jgi:excinuclease ABC subunit C
MTESSPNSDKATPVQKKMSRVSDDPGVYMMKDAAGTILYIGKARNLKKRLAAYFKNSGHTDIKTGILVKKIVDFETVITRTEKEALILEANLIKRYKPRYNVILKDDKRYPSLRLDLKEEYPSFTIARKIGLDDALYFGPFASAYAVRETLKMINRTFKLRKCKAKDFKTRTRPCLHCQMEGCLAPCCLDVDPGVYRENINEAIMFLNGRTHDLIRKTKKQMQQAAADQEFEKAARLRDKMFSLEKTVEKHVAVITDFKDRDVFALAGTNDFWLVSLFIVRGGFLRGNRHFDFSQIMASDQEILGAFIRQYYEKNHFVPSEILVSSELEDRQLIEEFLTGLKNMKVRILHPRKGKKAELVKMAVNNAEKELHDLIASRTAEMDVLNRLQKRLKLNRLPQRVECFDNSNISGTSPVAGMVVFEKGKPLKSAYRKYSIKTVSEHDDYAYMSEVLQRRFGKGEASRPYPDLLMVDGGKGQLNIAVSVVKNLDLPDEFEIIGIAKKDEKKGEIHDKVFKPGRVNPITFGREGDLLLFLQRIRDEAHRFAITFHRKRRQKSSLQSMLDTIPGIGKKRKATLFRNFKSLKAIRAASLEDLSALPGIGRRLAEEVHRTLSEI